MSKQAESIHLNAFIPHFILAQTAKAMGIDPIIYFLGMGVTVVKKGNAEKIKDGYFSFSERSNGPDHKSRC